MANDQIPKAVLCPYGTGHTVEIGEFGYTCKPPPECPKPCTLVNDIEEEEEEDELFFASVDKAEKLKATMQEMRNREEIEQMLAEREKDNTETYLGIAHDSYIDGYVAALRWVLKQDNEDSSGEDE